MVSLTKFITSNMNSVAVSRFFTILAVLLFSSCVEDRQIPVLQDYVVHEVDIKELSGLDFNMDRSSLVACGDKGVVAGISFDGIVTELYSHRSDMEGVTVDPNTGDLYLAVERLQEIHKLAAPRYTEETLCFAVQEALSSMYANDGLEAVEYYKDDILFVGSQFGANLWQYRTDGTLVSMISLSSFASEIAGLYYDDENGLLWVTDSEIGKIFLCTPEGELKASYDISFIKNAESICVDRKGNCVWVGSDEEPSKLYRFEVRF